MARYKVVFARHGESEWNRRNLFCGWYDSELSEKGRQEAFSIAEKLKLCEFDTIFTSVLTRANVTVNMILRELSKCQVEVHKAWQLNERHYGALTGYNKAEMAEKYGLEQVQTWRRSYDILPPPMEKDHKCYNEIINNPIFRNAGLSEGDIPKTESLATTELRVVPFWKNCIIPRIKEGKKVLVIAHGTSLRAMIKHLDNISTEGISELNVPTGIPFVYEFNDAMEPLHSLKFLSDDETVKKAMAKVASIGTKEN